MQQPQNLIIQIVVVRHQIFCGQRKVHGDGAAERPGTDGPGRNIFVRLPENDLIRRAVFSGSDDYPAHTTEPQIDAMGGLRFKSQMNSPAHALPGRKREGVELEVGIAEALMPDGCAQRIDKQNRLVLVSAAAARQLRPILP